MKRIVFAIIVIATAVMCWYGCKKDEPEQEPKGSVFGTVLDKWKDTLINAKITLLNQANVVEDVRKTGSSGDYEFRDLKLGSYTLIAELSGYHSDTISPLAVKKMNVCADFTLRKTALRLSNDTIKLGTNDNAEFTIYNESRDDIAWWTIDENINWFSLNKTSNKIPANNIDKIQITIYRTQLKPGTNEVKLVINSSSHEYAELILSVVGEEVPVLNTKVSYSGGSTATFNGTITVKGSPEYKERGFVY